MLNFKEKILVLFVVVALVACIGALVSSLNKKMIDSCIAGGHSVNYCETQVLYK